MWHNGVQDNLIKGNNITNNQYSINVISDSNSNTISENYIKNSDVGIGLTSVSNNQITENNIIENDFGAYLNTSSGNSVVNNSFLNNTNQVFSLGSPNTWNSENLGNFWSDYQEKYPNAEIVDQSGTWNTPSSGARS